jgi:Putative prokaryotic signal transducing protein
MKDWVCVYTFNKEYQSEFAVQMLADNDIEAVVLNKMDSNYRFGEIELYVHTNQVIRAKMLLNQFEQ